MTSMKPAWPYVGEVARSLLGVLLAVVFAVQWADPVGAMAAGGGAAIAGATALQDNPRRLRSVLTVSVAAGVAVLLGSVSAGHGPLPVLVVLMWSAGAGMLWAVSANAGLVATALGALLVCCGHTPVSVQQALAVALLAIGGGLTQVVLVAAWPRQHWRVQHAALSAAYRSVADGTRQLAADPAASFDVTPLLALRDTYTVTERQARRRPPAFRGLFGLPEQVAMAVTTLRAVSPDRAAHAVLAAAATALDRIADGSRADAEAALAELDPAVDRVPAAALLPARRLQAQLHEAASLRFGGSMAPLGTLKSARKLLRAQLSSNSPILRHALRLSVAAGLGAGLAAVTGITQGYWIAVTVLLVLRPETAHTYTRCVVRVAALVAGVVVATGVTVLWHPSGIVAAVLATALVGVAYAVSGVGYVPVTGALAMGSVFLADIAGSVHSDALGERVLAAILGGALAIGSHVLLPDRSLVRLDQRAGELLKAEIDYAATVIGAVVHPLTDAEAVIAAAWDRTVRARSAFEAASGSARADAPEVRRWLTTYRAGINAVTASCAVLERYVPASRSQTVDRRFVVAVDDFVDALRGEVPRAGQAWTLDATHLVATEQQLRESATYLDKSHVAQRVLVSEIETITRQLMTVADA